MADKKEGFAQKLDLAGVRGEKPPVIEILHKNLLLFYRLFKILFKFCCNNYTIPGDLIHYLPHFFHDRSNYLISRKVFPGSK
jgi:hypothetical protein